MVLRLAACLDRLHLKPGFSQPLQHKIPAPGRAFKGKKNIRHLAISMKPVTYSKKRMNRISIGSCRLNSRKGSLCRHGTTGMTKNLSLNTAG